MRVTLIGTGCPAAHPERGGAATLIEAGGAAVVIDCGSGVAQGLVAAGRPGRSLDALVLTHLHSDHLVDFYQLVISSWHQGRDRSWRVYGPEGTRRFVEATMALWAEERAARIAHERRPSTAGLTVETTEIVAGARVDLGALALETVAVDHRPVDPAFGFVARDGAHVVVVSGDTRASANLIAAGRGADLLVHEVFVHHAMRPEPGVRSRETIEAVAGYHTLSSEVGGVAARMGARALALTHFVPPDVDRAALAAEVAQSYDGPILIGEDGLCVDVAARLARAGRAHWRYAAL